MAGKKANLFDKKNELDTSKRYSTILQCNATNTLTTLNRKNFEVNLNGTGEIMKNEVRIFLDEIEKIKLSPITWRIFDYLMIKLTENLGYGENLSVEELEKRRTISFTAKDYALACGLNSLHDAREQLIEGIRAISRITLKFSEPKYEKKGKRTLKKMINYQMPITGLVITLTNRKEALEEFKSFNFSFDFVKYIANTFILKNYPTSLLKINVKKNPNSYFLGRKIITYDNINTLKGKPKKIISVKALLENTPEIISYKDIKNKGRISERIIEPFERDMNYLQEIKILKNWEYCNSRGTSLKEKDMELMEYKVFENLYIKYDYYEE